MTHLLNKEQLYKQASLGGASFTNFLNDLDDSDKLAEKFPEFAALKGFLHDTRYHPESPYVIKHVLECIRHSRSIDPVVNLSIALHDCGKPVSYCASKEKNGRFRIHTYDGHESKALPIIKKFGEKLNLPQEDIEAMCFAAYRHMVMHRPGQLKQSKLESIVKHK
jgi:HD superfamily phosphodiesterase